MIATRKKLAYKLLNLIKQDPEHFLSALVNTIDTVHERSAPQLTERRPQEGREARIVQYIADHF